MLDASSEPVFITVAEIVQLTGLCRETIRAMIADGRLPRPHGCTGPRGKKLLPRAEVMAMLIPSQNRGA